MTWRSGTSRFRSRKYNALAQGGSPLSYAAMVQPQPTAYWKLDETAGTAAADASGNGYTGAVLGGCAWTTGKNGNGLNFDGSNGYIDAPLNVSESAATISLWFKTTSPNTGLFEVSDGGTSCDRGFHLKNGNLEAFLYSNECDRHDRVESRRRPMAPRRLHLWRKRRWTENLCRWDSPRQRLQEPIRLQLG